MASSIQNFEHRLRLAESSKGTPLPTKVIEKLLSIAEENPEYNFFIGTAHSLSRKKVFFRENRENLQFFNKNGEPFLFTPDARENKRNELFFAINFADATGEAFVYVYFPSD